MRLITRKSAARALLMAALAVAISWTGRAFALSWNEAEFAAHQLVAVPIPVGRDALIGSPTSFTITKGDTLLDIGRWYGLSAREISDANSHIDWWAPPPGRDIILPTERILPEGARSGIVMNIPEMRIYYFYPPTVAHRRGKLRRAALSGGPARVVYTFPVGLGRFDWKTPVSVWRVTGKIVNPTWVVPEDIYEEHLERDGEAEHVVPGGEPDNPLGHFKLVLSLPEYAIHGTDVPWGVGMNVSHGCIRLYPENIEQLFRMTPVGTPGRFVYQPIKFGWRGDRLYAEVHDDLYGVYPGLWNHALHEVKRLRLESSVDMGKLQAAVEGKTGLPTDVSPGGVPAVGAESASATKLPASSAVTANPAAATAESADSAASVPDENGSDDAESAPPDAAADSTSRGADWRQLPTHVTPDDNSIE